LKLINVGVLGFLWSCLVCSNL